MWKKVEISLSCYYIKQSISSDRVVTSLLDLVNLWEEDVSKEEAIDRFKESNPNVKAPDLSIIEFITSVEDSKECNLQIEAINSSLTLKMCGTLFPNKKYEFNLLIRPAEAFFREITLPLIMLVSEMKYRQDVLCQQLEAKDVELMEYQLEQHKITRKNVITPKFIKEEFLTESSRGTEGRLKSSLGSMKSVFLEDFNKFYPVFKTVVLPLSTNVLKEGKSLKEEKEELLEKIPEEALPPKRKYAVAPAVPIKRSKTKKCIF